jgi:acetamidase/formamidase
MSQPESLRAPSLTRRSMLAGGAGLTALAAAGIAAPVQAKAAPVPTAGPAFPQAIHLKSRPETIHWGFFDAALPPVLHVKPGDVVTIDTLSHQGMINGTDPVTFFGEYGIAPQDVLQDAIDVYAAKQPQPGMSAHIMTGPIYVQGAEPGDVLEVRILESHARVPYGVNKTGPGSGVLPNLLTEGSTMVIPLDLRRKIADVAPGVNVPIDAFQGIMCTAPAPALGMVSSRPPGPFGGNMDLRDLVSGCTLYLPVFNDGALFSTGDGHTAQGDGEVDGTAIETSLTTTVQFFLHKGMDASWPGAESPTHFITMGIDTDLDTALAISLQQAVDFLQQRVGLTAAQAYTLASVAVDFEIAEAVNYTKVVHGRIPKSIFSNTPTYWAD